jgi:hypothetical protein
LGLGYPHPQGSGGQEQRTWALVACQLAIRGTVVWTLWMERNDAIFNDIKWSPSMLKQKKWFGIVDYGRLDWEVAKLKADNKFQEVWCKNKILAVMERGKPKWKLSGHKNGYDVH